MSASHGSRTRALRAGDLIARAGADKFMIVLPDCSADAAETVVRRLCMYMPLGHSCSVGVVSWAETETAGELLARATRAEKCNWASARRSIDRRLHSS